MMMLICIKKHLNNIFEAHFTKKLSNTEAELEKSLAYNKKKCKTTDDP